VSKGLIIVLTGEGKGKTTAALGMALRAWGHEKKVLVIQFIKGKRFVTGESLAAERLGERFTIKALGEGFISAEGDLDRHRTAAQRAVDSAREALSNPANDVVVLDEITLALKYGLITEKQVFDLINLKPPATHLVLTGRDAPPSLVEAGDLVTEMKCVKHHYQQGVEAQQGVEY
jgi:cob(I)alamin adenosyltransferase